MANLRDLRTRVRSIRSTQKITSAMKMVAAAKLRSAQERVEAIRPYETNMQGMVSHLLSQQHDLERRPLLLAGHPDINNHLLIIVTTNRGLCGGFNSALAREAKTIIHTLQEQGKNVEIFCLGRKGQNLLRHDYGSLFFEIDLDKTASKKPDEQDHKMLPGFQESLKFSTALQMLAEKRRFGEFSILFTIFRSALHQEIAHHALIPFPLSSGQAGSVQEKLQKDESGKAALYEYEPSPDSLLSHLLKRYLAVHFYRVLLENHASEQGARMMAMDNATRNAQDIIQSLERTYHQTRQAFITKELIEIISAAEAM